MHKNPGDRTVLVVEDEASAQFLLKAQLATANFNAVCVRDGQEALAWLNDNVPRLVILDLMLPGSLSGFDVCKWIRRRYDSSSLPVLMLTAMDLAIREPLYGWEHGANALMPKPYRAEQLLSCIDYLLDPETLPADPDGDPQKDAAKGGFLFMRQRTDSEPWISTVPRILVAEDEAYLRRVFARTLRSRGYDVREAADGDAVMEMLGLGVPDILLLDVHMPGAKSTEIIEAVRRARGQHRILVITGDEEAFNEPEFRQVDLFLTKPVSTRTLAALVHTML